MKKITKLIGLSAIVASTLMATPNDDYVLKRAIDTTKSLIMDNHYIKVGVSDDGTFGVGGNTKPGFQLSVNGDGNYSYTRPDTNVTTIPDYLTPGTPFEGFSIKFTEITEEGNTTTYLKNQNSSDTDIMESNITTLSKFSDNNISAVLHQAVIPEKLNIRQVYKVDESGTILKIQVFLTNISDKTLYDVKYARFLDPDPDVDAYGTYDTKNQLGLNIVMGDKNITIPATNIAYALGENTKMPVGVFTFDNKYKHNAVISPSWTKDPDVILKGGCNGDGDVNATSCSKGDYTIGLAFDVDKIKPGETKVIDLGYLFGNSLSKAVESSTKAVLDKGFIDSLGLGWHLVGSGDAILDMSIFDNVDIVWAYDGRDWYWYTTNEEYLAVLEISGFKKLTSLKPLSGIWVYKRDITFDIPTDEYYDEGSDTDATAGGDEASTEKSMFTLEDVKGKKVTIETPEGETETIEFYDDGTYKRVDADETETGSYTVTDAGVLIVTSEEEEVFVKCYSTIEEGVSIEIEGPDFKETDTIISIESL